MPEARPLEGLHLLVTRPQEQGQRLASTLQALGARTSLVPLLGIETLDPDQDTRQALLDLDRFEVVVFISRNAARAGLDAIAQYWPQWPIGLQVMAVGRSTAAELEAAGLRVITPAEETSEGLLALPELQAVAGKRILIIRGLGGRETLAEHLRQRGARVEYAQVYRRILPREAAPHLEDLLAGPPPDVVLLSSGEALAHWQDLAGDKAMTPALLVVSARIEEEARAGGATRTILSRGARDADVVEALCHWAQQRTSSV